MVGDVEVLVGGIGQPQAVALGDVGGDEESLAERQMTEGSRLTGSPRIPTDVFDVR